MQQYTLEQSSAPATEPTTAAECKAYGWITTSDDDAVVDGLIKAVRGRLERLSGLQLVTATWKMYLDFFPWCGKILVPKPPLQAVSSITYPASSDGTATTWSSSEYQVDAKSQPGRIRPAYGYTWPSIRPQMNAVCVTFTAGFGAITAVPYEIKHLIWQAVKYRFDHRDETNEQWLDTFLARHWHGWIW